MQEAYSSRREVQKLTCKWRPWPPFLALVETSSSCPIEALWNINDNKLTSISQKKDGQNSQQSVLGMRSFMHRSSGEICHWSSMQYTMVIDHLVNNRGDVITEMLAKEWRVERFTKGVTTEQLCTVTDTTWAWSKRMNEWQHIMTLFYRCRDPQFVTGSKVPVTNTNSCQNIAGNEKTITFVFPQKSLYSLSNCWFRKISKGKTRKIHKWSEDEHWLTILYQGNL